MKYRKYRTAAKAIFLIPFVLALLAAGVYTGLTYFDVVEAPFEWEYLAALGGVVALAIFLAFWLLCISCSVKKREERELNADEEQTLDACAAEAVEPEYIYIQQPATAPDRNTTIHASFSWGNRKSERSADAKLDPATVKKTAMIAIPTAAITAGIAVAIATKARKKRKIKQLLRDLEHTLGYRR